MSGGVRAQHAARARRRRRVEGRVEVAGSARRPRREAWISAAVRSGSPQRRRLRPSARGANTRGSGVDERQPPRGQAQRLHERRRDGPAVWATVETWKPGWNSSVTAAPPSDVAALEHERLEARPSPAGPRWRGRCGRRPTTTTSPVRAARVPAPVLQDLQRGDAAGRAHDPAAGVRGRAAHVEAAHGRAVAGPARHRPQEEELLERQLALEDVALGQAPLALEVERGQHLAVQDELLDVGRVLRDGVDHGVAERLALLVPRALAQLVGRVLHEARQDVLAGRRDRRDRSATGSPCRCTAASSSRRTWRRRTRAPCTRRWARWRWRRAGARPGPGRHVKSGRPSRARLTLPEEPRSL